MSALLVTLILASVSLNAAAQVALRKAMLVAAPLPPLGTPVALVLSLVSNLYLWCGMLCFAGSIALWLGVLARIPVSIAYPMASLGYIVAAASGVVFLGETIPLWRGIGLVLICGGVYLVAASS